jgi:CyaY protein
MLALAEYGQLADACLKAVDRWVTRLDDDALDCTPGDGLLVLEFDDGTRFVLNRQSAARQMWFAAGARAWHYDWDADRRQWVDDRDGHPLTQRLAAVVGEKLGRPVAFEE